MDSLFATIRLGISGYFFYLLISGRQIFITQPKEKISHWFRKPGFVIVIVSFVFVQLSPFIMRIIEEYYTPKIDIETLKFLLEGLEEGDMLPKGITPEKLKEEIMKMKGKTR